MEPIIISIVVWVLILVGLLGTIVPVLPGTGLIFGGILLHALYFGVEEIGFTTLLILGIAALLSLAFDMAASAYGAAHFGATRFGVIGAVVGGVIGGVVLNLPGLLIGVFLGSVGGELFMAKKDMNQSLRAGWGSLLGFLGGTVIKFILGLIMIAVFVAKIFF